MVSERARFVIYRKDGRWHWEFRATNGARIARNAVGYRTRPLAEKAIGLVQCDSGGATVEVMS